MDPLVRTAHKEIDNSVEEVVTHRVSNGCRVELRGEIGAEFLPSSCEASVAGLPEVFDVVVLGNNEHLKAIHKEVDGDKGVKLEVSFVVSDLLRCEFEVLIEVEPEEDGCVCLRADKDVRLVLESDGLHSIHTEVCNVQRLRDIRTHRKRLKVQLLTVHCNLNGRDSGMRVWNGDTGIMECVHGNGGIGINLLGRHYSGKRP